MIVARTESHCRRLVTNFKFYKEITDNREFGKFLFDWLFEKFMNRAKSAS